MCLKFRGAGRCVGGRVPGREASESEGLMRSIPEWVLSIVESIRKAVAFTKQIETGADPEACGADASEVGDAEVAESGGDAEGGVEAGGGEYTEEGKNAGKAKKKPKRAEVPRVAKMPKMPKWQER